MRKFRNSLQRIAELETRWNIRIIPHPGDRDDDELHNITLVALATADNNNTIIICTELNFEIFGLSSKEAILTTIGKELMPYCMPKDLLRSIACNVGCTVKLINTKS